MTRPSGALQRLARNASVNDLREGALYFHLAKRFVRVFPLTKFCARAHNESKKMIDKTHFWHPLRVIFLRAPQVVTSIVIELFLHSL